MASTEAHKQLRIFLTGATGYVGGETLYQISREPALQDALVTCLVRDSSKAETIKQDYPKVNLIVADLDDEAKVRSEASNSDIVINLASTRHLKSAQAIVQGLNDRAKATPDQKAFWIQISGGTLLACNEIKQAKFGDQTDEVWNGLRNASEVEAIIRDNKGREVDNLALASRNENLNIALLVGPLIYGKGNGPGNQRSIQAPDMAKYILSKGHGFRLNAGLNRWSTIHVGDLSSLIVRLAVSAATLQASTAQLWNESGLYLPETGVTSFTDLSRQIVQEAHKQGLLQSADAEVAIDAAGADRVTPHGSILLGTNAVFDFSNAQQVPDWKAEKQTLQQTLEALVRSEAARR